MLILCEDVVKSIDASAWADFEYLICEETLVTAWQDTIMTSTGTSERCGEWNYEITQAGGAALDPAIYTVNSIANTLAI